MKDALTVVFYSKYSFKNIDLDIIKSSQTNAGIKWIIIPSSVEREDLLSILKNINFDIFLHKNEHCKLNTCCYIKNIISYCYDNNKIPCYIDYGYFEHYYNYIIDYYLSDCESSIKKIFTTLPTCLTNLQENIQKYIYNSKIENESELQNYNKFQDLGLNKGNFITIWAQYSAKLVRENLLHKKEKNIINWFNKIIEQINCKNLIPVIKASPCEINYDINEIKGKPIIFCSKREQAEKLNLLFYENINNFLNKNSHAHVINCSSISSELLVSHSKIAATGISWFNDLDIFYEPENWDNLFDFPNQNKENINKWINWWNIRQFPKNNINSKLKEIFNEFHNENRK